MYFFDFQSEKILIQESRIGDYIAGVVVAVTAGNIAETATDTFNKAPRRRAIRRKGEGRQTDHLDDPADSRFFVASGHEELIGTAGEQKKDEGGDRGDRDHNEIP
jgi:hypothetical protein